MALVADGPYDLRAVVTDTTGNVANTLLPGLPKTVDNTAPVRLGHRSCRRGLRPERDRCRCERERRHGPARVGSLGRALRDQACRCRRVQRLRNADRTFVGSTYGRRWRRPRWRTGSPSCGSSSRTSPATSRPRPEHGERRQRRTGRHTRRPRCRRRRERQPQRVSSADTVDVTFRYRPVGTLGAGTAIASDATAPFALTWTTAPAAEQQWELIAVATDGGGNVTTSAPASSSSTAPSPRAASPPPRPARTSAARPSPWPRRRPRRRLGRDVVEWQVRDRCRRLRHRRSDTTAPYAGTWNSTAAPDGAPISARSSPTQLATSTRPPSSRSGRLHRPERDPRRPRRCRLGHGVADRDDRRRRKPRPVRGQPGERGHVDADRRRHDGAVRDALRHDGTRRRPLRPPRNRLRRARQRLHGLDP